jgi:D-alanyl-D-alanine carboxypeptidase (penicillin-binding protein 5/6)
MTTVVVSTNAWSQNPVFNGSSLMWIEPGKAVTIGELERGDRHLLRQ